MSCQNIGVAGLTVHSLTVCTSPLLRPRLPDEQIHSGPLLIASAPVGDQARGFVFSSARLTVPRLWFSRRHITTNR